MRILRNKTFSDKKDNELAYIAPGLAVAGTGTAASQIIPRVDLKRVKKVKKDLEEGRKEIRATKNHKVFQEHFIDEDLQKEVSRLEKKRNNLKTSKGRSKYNDQISKVKKEAQDKKTELGKKIEKAKDHVKHLENKKEKVLKIAKRNKKIMKPLAIGSAVVGSGTAIIGHEINKHNK